MTSVLPPRVMSAFVASEVGNGAWPYGDDASDPYWAFGATPVDYQWTLQLTLDAQHHSSVATREPRIYNGLDVRVGDWIASTTDGISVKIVSILSKSATNVTCIVEDVFRYNTFRDPSGMGRGLFTVPTNAVIFTLSRELLPIIDPLPAGGVGIEFLPNITSRFANADTWNNFFVHQIAHGFSVGDVVSVDPVSRSFVPSSNAYPLVVGSVEDVFSIDDFSFKPSKRTADCLDSLPGGVGDILYADNTDPGELSVVSGVNPVLIKLRNDTPTILESTIPQATTMVGNSIMLNGILVATQGGTSPALIAAINGTTPQHFCTATLYGGDTVVSTSNSLINTAFQEVLLAIPSSAPYPTATINGTLVTFNSCSSGTILYGHPYALAADLARTINAASIPHLIASVANNTLVLTETGGLGVTIVNGNQDQFGRYFAGSNSATGLALYSPPPAQALIRIAAPDARSIDISDVTGTMIEDFGLFSVENGYKAAGMYIDQGIRHPTSAVLPTLAALSGVAAQVGDQTYVLDKGNSSWGLFLFDGSNWVEIASQESSKAQSGNFIVNFGPQNATLQLGSIRPGARVTDVTLRVLTAFDGAPSLSVGSSTSVGEIASPQDFDLTTAANYVSLPVFSSSDPSNDYLVIATVTGTATTGSAQLIVSYQ